MSLVAGWALWETSPLRLDAGENVGLFVAGALVALAGATVVSQIRYRFGYESPPGCTAVE